MPIHRRPGIWIAATMWLLAAILWRLDASHPSHTIAQSIPVAAATTNAFWGGYVATQGAPYTAIQATWTIPTISCNRRSGNDATTYVWIGEGGYLEGLASPLIQAGTGSDCFSALPRYHAFFEWYPGIYATDFPISVRPGDSVTVHLQQAQPDYWVISFRDNTNGARSATAVWYHVDMGSADFIVERPNVCTILSCRQPALGKFDPIIFDDARTQTLGQTSYADVSRALPIALADPSTNHRLAIPARLRTGARSLSVIWRRGW